MKAIGYLLIGIGIGNGLLGLLYHEAWGMNAVGMALADLFMISSGIYIIQRAKGRVM